MLIFSSLPALRSHSRFVVAVALLASASACKDFTSVEASLPNLSDTTSVYAINGSPPGTPTAVNFFNVAFFRANQGFAFDIAFDIDADGKVVVIPALALATSFSTPYSVGLAIMPGPNESVLEAPKDGYALDSVLHVPVGAVIAVESHDFNVCGIAIKGQSHFSKVSITTIDVAQRRIGLAFTINRNCGFRSFAAGIPRD